MASSSALKTEGIWMLSPMRAASMGFNVTLLSDGHATSDLGALTAEQIIDHHNILSGFDAGAYRSRS